MARIDYDYIKSYDRAQDLDGIPAEIRRRHGDEGRHRQRECYARKQFH